MKNSNYLTTFDLDGLFNLLTDGIQNPNTNVGNVNHSFDKDDDNFYIELSLAGFSKEEIDIEFEDGNLIVSSSVNDKWKEEFKKVFKIKQQIDSENINAELDKGILKITLPKTDDIKSRKIKIK